MSIDKPDPYLEHYAYEKMKDPSTPIVWKQYEKRMVEATDHIVELARGHRSTIKTAEEWDILKKLIEFWADYWPQEWKEFKGQISDIKLTRARKDGYSREKGKAGVRYLAAMPPRLIKLIQAIFPDQEFDRKFMNKLGKNIPIFTVGQKVDQVMINKVV